MQKNYLQSSNSAMMDIARCVIVKFVLSHFPLGLLLFISVLRPIQNLARTFFVCSNP